MQTIDEAKSHCHDVGERIEKMTLKGMRYRIVLTAIMAITMASGLLMANASSWIDSIYKDANTKDTLMYFVWVEYDVWLYNLKSAIKHRKLKEAKKWYDAIEGTIKLNFMELAKLRRGLSAYEQTKNFADKCGEVFEGKYKREPVSRVFTIASLFSTPGFVLKVRQENFDKYDLDTEVMEMYFNEDVPDEFHYIAEFVPRNLLIDGEIEGGRALYYDGTTRDYSADREHSKVANLVAREHGTLSRLFKDGRSARYFLASLFEKYPNARVFEEKYREILPGLKKKASATGRLTSRDAYDFVR